MSRTILDYFSQNYDDLLALAVQVCARVSVKPDAGEDVLHQVVIVLCQRHRELDDVQDYGAYIATCIRRAAINYARKESHTVPVGLERFDNEPDRRLSEGFDYTEWVATLEKHLYRFKPEMRKAFVDHYINDAPLTQVAESLGISEKALSSRFTRMRRELKKNAASLFRHLNVLLMIG